MIYTVYKTTPSIAKEVATFTEFKEAKQMCDLANGNTTTIQYVVEWVDHKGNNKRYAGE